MVVAVVSSLALAAGGCSSSGSSPAAKSPTAACPVPEPTTKAVTQPAAPVVPSQGAYVGAFALNGEPTQQNLVGSLSALADQVCRPLDIAHLYLRWRAPFPTTSSREFASQGKDLLVSWTGTDTAEMASGADDAEIINTAHQIAAAQAPVFLELRWEMNRPNLLSSVHSPADYIAAWDHVHELFAAAGVHNVSWVWCPTAVGFADGTAPAYYPGDDEVDWICTDAYPGQIVGGPAYKPFSRLVRPFLTWSRQHDKPLMIGEFGVPQSYSPAERALWFRQALATVRQSPRIKALVYFDANVEGAPSARKYQVGSDAEVQEAFRALVNDPYVRLRIS